MNKHFRATPLAGGEPIEFGLGDIRAFWDSEWLGIGLSNSSRLITTEGVSISIMAYLKDYKIQYKHQGTWYDYE